MIRSVKLSTKSINQNKEYNYNSFLEEYRNVVSQFIDILWNMKNISVLLPKEITNKINNTWLSARAIQSAGKQASSIVRGTRQKQKQRLYKLKQLQKEGTQYNNIRKLQQAIAKANMTKPNISDIHPDLDSRFIQIDDNNNTTFDIWITLSSLGNKLKIPIPLKKTKVYNKWNNLGKLKPSIRLYKNKIEVIFDIQDKPNKAEGNILGLDIGIKNTYYASDKQHSRVDNHGHTLESIINKLSRKMKGSKSFERTQQHRKNYINWSINQLNLNNTKQVNVEDIKYLRYKSRFSRELSHWTYTDIFDKIGRYCEEQNVSVHAVNPIYTSQRCSVCGWTQKKNRKGKVFCCLQCGNTMDSDLNASLNLSFVLPELSKKDCSKHLNKDGFYWNILDSECIVPNVQKI
jgi:putative transposase